MKKIFTFTLAILATMSLWADSFYVICGKCNVPLAKEIKGAVTAQIIKSDGTNIEKTEEISSTTIATANVYYNSTSAAYEELTKTSNYSASSSSDRTMQSAGIKKGGKIEFTLNDKMITKIDVVYTCSSTDECSLSIEGEAVSTKDKNFHLYSKEGNFTNKITIENTSTKDKEYRIFVILTPKNCEAPENPLVLKASKTVDVVAGDEITFSTEGGNGADVTIAGKDGETVTANKWTAVKGEHTFTATQDVKDGKCGNTVELKIVVVGTDPVTSAKITGPKNAKVGTEVTLTCEAAEATSFQWYKGGAKIDGATKETYSFTPDAAGDIIFACEAWNKNNTDENHAKSADFKVTVVEADVVCGEIIKAVHKNGKTADVSGEIGGEVDKNTQDGGKLGSDGHYFGIKLKEGKFKAGDKLTIHASTVSTIVQIFSDKGTTMLNEGTFDENGDYRFKLTDETEWIYLYRTSEAGKNMNPTVEYMAVSRSCGTESKDASLKYLTINGDTVKAENNIYNYEIPVAYAAADVKVKYELNDAGAKSSKDLEFTIFAPDEVGDTIPAKFTVTAEDGITAIDYTVNIIRVQTASGDATIKELKVNNTVVAEKEGVFAYEVPAEVKLAKVAVEFVLSNPDAKADKASGFEMDVPAAGAAANEATINVVAKDGKTKKAYKVSVTRATAPDQALEGVQATDNSVQKVLLNGQLFILKNGVLYNATGSVVK